jgi:hypothetical protein
MSDEPDYTGVDAVQRLLTSELCTRLLANGRNCDTDHTLCQHIAPYHR